MKPDQPLFRIISLESFLQLITYKETRFVNPLSWDDTYEGCALQYIYDEERLTNFLNALFAQYKNEKDWANIVLNTFAKAEMARDFNYGKCWSTTEDSDAMWRIYNYGNHAIQIESSLDALRKNVIPENKEGMIFLPEIARVKYDVKASDKDSAYVRFYAKGKSFSESFFHKRDAFKHEQEVRVLYRPKNTQYEFTSRLNKYRQKLTKESNNSSGKVINKDLIASIIKEVHSETKVVHDPRFQSIKLEVRELSEYIKRVRVHPWAEDWYVDLIETICNEHSIKFGGKSSLYGKA